MYYIVFPVSDTFFNLILELLGIEFVQSANFISTHSDFIAYSTASTLSLGKVKLNSLPLTSPSNICKVKDQIDQSHIISGGLRAPYNKNLVLSCDFIEWFRGFTDAEGSFIIVKGLGNRFTFHFAIRLHLDDKGVLDYINNTLGIGTVTVSKTKAEVVFLVRTQGEIEVILELFTKYPLNTTKHLNFVDFSKAFELYVGSNSPEKREELRSVIIAIKSGMNSKRTDFSLPLTHYRITKY